MIRDAATQAQVDAASPEASTWLSANAGSGKTRVLTDRVARLLLNGTDPQNVLCLTYTKAAASEMQNRLFRRLGEWAMMPDVALHKQLRQLGVDHAPDLAEARRLFATAIETPGGLKIQTIHSFCSGILRRFPLEAGISPRFREIEEHETSLLLREILEEMARGADRPLVDSLAAEFSGAEVTNLMKEIARNRATFEGSSEQEIAGVLGLDPTLTEDDVLARVLGPGDRDLLRDTRNMAHNSGTTDQRVAAKLDQIDLDAPLTLASLSILEDCFLTGAGAKAPYTAKIDTFPMKATRDSNLDLVGRLNELMQWVEDGRDLRLRFCSYRRSIVLHRFARRFLALYEDRKIRHGVLDFDDLILRTRALLSDERVAQWVLFRLDGGVDHILVDEAQDTSPAQWDVIDLLTREFTSGEGARAERERTIFVVGDKKQSIYSFQGADPEGFDRMRETFGAALSDIRKDLRESELTYSFRSSAAILQLVDRLFQGDRAQGLGDALTHIAFNAEQPGRVDLWPVIEKTEDPSLPWNDPLDQITEAHHEARLAARIADEILRMTREETITVREGERWVRRTVQPGDILILVRRRKTLFKEIISACKARGLAIGGADRLKLGEDLAVRDIMALLSFLALPEDDLSLAAALRSPLFGWSERALYALAQPRPDRQTLWEALRRKGDAPAPTLDVLNDLRSQTDFQRPFDLINRLLLHHDGRRKLIARLGPEAEDGIDALLAQALVYENAQVPSLTGFLAWFEAEEIELKRQMDSAENRIRVMTVHGAKGLEAPIVFLPDCASRRPQDRGEVLSVRDVPLWKGPVATLPAALTRARTEALEAEDRESRRLFYVAMTRAESWLIVAAAGDVGTGDESWYGMVQDTLPHLGAEKLTTAFGEVQRFSFGTWDGVALVEGPAQTAPEPVDRGFGAALPTLPEPQRMIAPSDLEGDTSLPGERLSISEEAAKAHGTLVHHLLEVLPDAAPEARPDLARALLRHHPDTPQAPDPDAVIREALAVLDHPALAPLFHEGLAEVAITAQLDALGGARINGTIDRLIVSGTTVQAIDFKSNRTLPEGPEQVPLGILRQLAAYRDALVQIYPDRVVRMSILWTQGPLLMEIPDAALTAALATVSPP